MELHLALPDLFDVYLVQCWSAIGPNLVIEPGDSKFQIDPFLGKNARQILNPLVGNK